MLLFRILNSSLSTTFESEWKGLWGGIGGWGFDSPTANLNTYLVN